MAPLEAIASGVPVAAHRSGGITEFINGQCGLLIDSEDPAEWSRQCAAFIENNRSQAGFRKKVQECALNYQWSRTLTPALEIIDKVSSIRDDVV
jgi:glycosyltransferase involved in cell wall biosynthesis